MKYWKIEILIDWNIDIFNIDRLKFNILKYWQFEMLIDLNNGRLKYWNIDQLNWPPILIDLNNLNLNKWNNYKLKDWNIERLKNTTTKNIDSCKPER